MGFWGKLLFPQHFPIGLTGVSGESKCGEEICPLLSVSPAALGEAFFQHHEDPCSSVSRNAIIFNCYVTSKCAHTDSYPSQDPVLVGCVLMCVWVMSLKCDSSGALR